MMSSISSHSISLSLSLSLSLSIYPYGNKAVTIYITPLINLSDGVMQI